MRNITADKVDDLWGKTKDRSEFLQNLMTDIEEAAEFGPTCAKVISQDIGVTIADAETCLRRLVLSGALKKGKDKMRIGGEMHVMYEVPNSSPWQAKLIPDEPVKRDWIVAAFFGEKTCITR